MSYRDNTVPMIWSRIIVHWTCKRLCPLKRSHSSRHIEGIQKAEKGQLTRNFLPLPGFEAAGEEQFNSAHPQARNMLWSFESKGVIRGRMLIETFRRNDKNRWSAIPFMEGIIRTKLAECRTFYEKFSMYFNVENKFSTEKIGASS